MKRYKKNRRILENKALAYTLFLGYAAVLLKIRFAIYGGLSSPYWAFYTFKDDVRLLIDRTTFFKGNPFRKTGRRLASNEEYL